MAEHPTFLQFLFSPLATWRARKAARQAAEDAADLALIEERLNNPVGPNIPWEQVKREAGL